MAKTQKQKKDVSTKPQDARSIPDFTDNEGVLRKLKGSDFPKTKAGKLAWCDYNSKKWEVKREAVEKGMDPAAKAKKRREKLLKQLAALDETIAESEK